MAERFLTSEVSGKRWYNGCCWFFEFADGGILYLGASRTDDFSKAIVVEQVPGQELKQLRQLEEDIDYANTI